MQNASGISLYYPVEGNDLLSLPKERGLQEITAAAAVGAATELTYTLTYSRYVTNQLFDFTSVTRWAEFLVAAYGEVPPGVQVLAPTAPLTVPVPVNNTRVTMYQTYRLEDKDNNGPSAGDTLHVETKINNQSEVTLTNVVLMQLFDQAVQPVVSTAQFPCMADNPKQACRPVTNIAATTNQPVTLTVTLAANALPVTQAILYVNGKPLGEPVIPTERQSLLYLPVVMKK